MTNRELKIRKHQELQDLIRKFDLLEVIGETKLSNSLKKIRHYVLNVHEEVERYIEYKITFRLYKLAVNSNKFDEPERTQSWYSLYYAMSHFYAYPHLSFGSKSKLAKEILAIDSETAVLVGKVNKARNSLAHVLSEKYSEYVDESKQKELLKDMWKVLDIITLDKGYYRTIVGYELSQTKGGKKNRLK